MPALAFLSVVGLVLTALLFVADAKLKKSSSPAIVTSQRIGLSEPQYHNARRTLTNTPAPAPDMTSPAYLLLSPRRRVTLWRRSNPQRVRRGPKSHPKRRGPKRQPKRRGSKRQPKRRGPKRHPKISASRRPITTNRPLCSTDFLLRVIRAGRPKSNAP
jgi:hypothetical protein